MKRKTKNKEAAHLQKKMKLYESFLYRYLPQLASLSHITRLNLSDFFGSSGLDRLGSQGTPFTLFNALAKQRRHQLKKKGSLKPLSLSIISLNPQSSFSRATDHLLQENTQSNTCRLDSWTASTFPEAIRQLSRQIRQQANSEKNLLLLDPLGVSSFLARDLSLLPEKKAEIILYLPLKILWQLHTRPEKTTASEELCTLKQTLDKLFPEGHGYWSEEASSLEFFHYLKEAFRLNGLFYTALEPAPNGTELPEGALLALSTDAYMMEKMLSALQALRTAEAPPPGEQLLLFSTSNSPGQEPDHDRIHSEAILHLLELEEEKDNQQLYEAALQAGVLPAQLLKGLHILLKEGKIEVLDMKKKPLQEIPNAYIGYTAFKAPGPACFFRRSI